MYQSEISLDVGLLSGLAFQHLIINSETKFGTLVGMLGRKPSNVILRDNWRLSGKS
ncbi:20336_t:CDS:2 [Racocetra persica]|uniref:20336_t:CDS:1 n=1 Tax=Racocetra persica TaxID=160502 RepID=A0ACA9LE47_9GLOM|nr:20336_t:CDS:2 [Racocetra persica]